jgi:hypothetical protein
LAEDGLKLSLKLKFQMEIFEPKRVFIPKLVASSLLLLNSESSMMKSPETDVHEGLALKLPSLKLSVN